MVTLRSLLGQIGDLAQRKTEGSTVPGIASILVSGVPELGDVLEQLGANKRKSTYRKSASELSRPGQDGLVTPYVTMESFELIVEGVKFSTARFRDATPQEDAAARLLDVR